MPLLASIWIEVGLRHRRVAVRGTSATKGVVKCIVERGFVMRGSVANSLSTSLPTTPPGNAARIRGSGIRRGLIREKSGVRYARRAETQHRVPLPPFHTAPPGKGHALLSLPLNASGDLVDPERGDEGSRGAPSAATRRRPRGRFVRPPAPAQPSTPSGSLQRDQARPARKRQRRTISEMHTHTNGAHT